MKMAQCPPTKHRTRCIKFTWPDRRHPDYWRVVCDCGRRGGEGATRGKAIKAWNAEIEEEERVP
mgnify:CR=1 FL=1